MIRKGSSGAPQRRSRMTPWVVLLVISLVLVPGAAACSADQGGAAVTPAVGHSGMHMMPNGTEMSAEEMDANWAARPAYTATTQRVQDAYAYAMRAWNVIEWMPCYCGCNTMGHASNLDCYYKPMLPGSTRLNFEEHASYCQICIDITLTASQLAEQGKSLLEIRKAVDRQYGSAGPGTDTALPAS